MPSSSEIRILPYSMRSASARLLADRLGGKLIKNDPTISKYTPKGSHLVINFGGGTSPWWLERAYQARQVLNHPSKVMLVSSKIDFFNHIKQSNTSVKIPEFTTSKEEARAWISAGASVYCRTLTRASQGRGIVVAHTVEELVDSPLYTKGINVKREYRAHVFKGEVIDLVSKSTRAGESPSNLEVRNHANGWVFTRGAVSIPETVQDSLVSTAITAVEACSLDFAAVDIVRSMDNQVYVLELNTAPGMEGTTLDAYVKAVQQAAM